MAINYLVFLLSQGNPAIDIMSTQNKIYCASLDRISYLFF